MPEIPRRPSKDGKIRVYDIKPYWRPASLDELKGPAEGRLKLPLTVYWGPPQPEGFDLTDQVQAVRAYSEIIANSDDRYQKQTLNKNLLVSLCPKLSVDKLRVRPAWEKAFPILRERREDSNGK